MDTVRVIEALWERIEARDWAAAGELLAEDVVVEWPVTAERIAGRKNFLGVNSAYPEGWSIRVLRVVGGGESGGTAASEVEVPHSEFGVFRVASFWTVRDGLIVHGREYWSGPGTEPAPQWRAPYTEPM